MLTRMKEKILRQFQNIYFKLLSKMKQMMLYIQTLY